MEKYRNPRATEGESIFITLVGIEENEIHRTKLDKNTTQWKYIIN